MSRVRIEHTNSRGFRHIFIGKCYVGAVRVNEIIVLPHFKQRIAELKRLIPRWKDLKWTVGVPASEDALKAFEKLKTYVAAKEAPEIPEPKPRVLTIHGEVPPSHVKQEEGVKIENPQEATPVEAAPKKPRVKKPATRTKTK